VKEADRPGKAMPADVAESLIFQLHRYPRQFLPDFGKGRHAAGLISATASPMRSPRSPASRSSSRGDFKKTGIYPLSKREVRTDNSAENNELILFCNASDFLDPDAGHAAVDHRQAGNACVIVMKMGKVLVESA